jgi:hypothetical protein
MSFEKTIIDLRPGSWPSAATTDLIDLMLSSNVATFGPHPTEP